MKKPNYFLFAVSLSMMIFAIVVGVALFNDSGSETAQQQTQQQKPQETAKQSNKKAINVPQLNEARADAATMVLISAPTLQPADHVGRWDPQKKGDSCLMCHEQGEAMGATKIPIDHYVDEDRSKGISGQRFTCVTCHGLDTGDPKPAFNRDN
jgi:nitrate reductase (cytochrome), electron transfer subunit